MTVVKLLVIEAYHGTMKQIVIYCCHSCVVGFQRVLFKTYEEEVTLKRHLTIKNCDKIYVHMLKILKTLSEKKRRRLEVG